MKHVQFFNYFAKVVTWRNLNYVNYLTGRPFAGELATDEWTPVGLLGKACHLFGENQHEATLGLLEEAGTSEVRAIALRADFSFTNQSESLPNGIMIG